MLKTDSILLVVSGSLREPNGLKALELANQFRLQGKKTGVYLLQNAVLGGVDEEAKILIKAQINSGIDFYCSEEDLAMRGLAEKDAHSSNANRGPSAATDQSSIAIEKCAQGLLLA